MTNKSFETIHTINGAVTPRFKSLGPTNIWLIAPFLTFIAAYMPLMFNAFIDINNQTIIENNAVSMGGFIANKIYFMLGHDGLVIFSSLSGAIIAWGVFSLARSLNSKIEIASILSIIAIIFPVIGVFPSLIPRLDDSLFVGFSILSAAYGAKSVKTANTSEMAKAFVMTVVASLLRPWAAWPQFALFLGITRATKSFYNKPVYALFAALCWGPGLYLIQEWAKHNMSFDANFYNFTLSKLYTNNGLVNHFDYAQLLPSIVLGIFAVISLIMAYRQTPKTKSAAIVLIFFTISALLGAFAYGDYAAAILLINMIFLGIIGNFLSIVLYYKKI